MAKKTSAKKPQRYVKIGFRTFDTHAGHDLADARKELSEQIHGLSTSRDKYEEEMIKDAKLIAEKVPDDTDKLIEELLAETKRANAREEQWYARLNPPPYPPPKVIANAPPQRLAITPADLHDAEENLRVVYDEDVGEPDEPERPGTPDPDDPRFVYIGDRTLGERAVSFDVKMTKKGEPSQAKGTSLAHAYGKEFRMPNKAIAMLHNDELTKLRGVLKNPTKAANRWVQPYMAAITSFAKAAGGKYQRILAPDMLAVSDGHGLQADVDRAVKKHWGKKGRGAVSMMARTMRPSSHKGRGFAKSGPGRGKFSSSVVSAMRDQLNEGLSMISMGYHSKQHVRDMRDLANKLYLLGKLNRSEQTYLKRALR